MANIIEVDRLDLPQLQLYTHLKDGQLKQQQDLFLAESSKVIHYALDAGYIPLSFLMERRQVEGAAASLLARCPEVPVYTADRALLEQLTGYAMTRGMLCAFRRKPQPAMDTILEGAQRITVLENVADPSNVGALFRNGAALGMDGILLSPTCCDPLYRKAVRTSMGTVFQLPWHHCSAQEREWPQDTIALLQRHGFCCVALALTDASLPIHAPELAAQPKLALFLGNEGSGLTAQTIAACDYTARIPMARGVDSLNVAAAGAVAFWQLGRKTV